MPNVNEDEEEEEAPPLHPPPPLPPSDPPSDDDAADTMKGVYCAMKRLYREEKEEQEDEVNSYSSACKQTFMYRPSIEIFWQNVYLKQVLPRRY